MDIKFSKMDTLKELLIELITKRLEELSLIPEVSVRDSYSVSEVRRQIISNDNSDDNVFNDVKVDNYKDKYE